MQNTLRNIVMASVAVAAIVVGTASASAESSVKVPFAFKVGNVVCPAGEYILEDGFSHNLVTLKSKDAKVNFAWILTPGDPAPGSTHVSLKFDEIGNTEILHSVQYKGQTTPTINRGAKSMERPITHTIEGQ